MLGKKAEVEFLHAEISAKEDKFIKAGGPQLLEYLSRIPEHEEERTNDKKRLAYSMPNDALSLLRKKLGERGYVVNDSENILLRQAFLAVCVAAETGQFVVLSGPPGSGKTSLTSNLAATLGAGYAAVPVRPAWIDPTDLLGFYNPSVRRYQPTPFTEKLLEAKDYSDNKNRLYFLVLDEMNLGRVENYAADFMAKLEKSKELGQFASIDLYSEETYRQLCWEQRRLCSVENEVKSKVDEVAEGCLLKQHLERYKSSLKIPAGLVLFGTINLDETTYHLSPKFLDRALVIQVTPTELILPKPQSDAVDEALHLKLEPVPDEGNAQCPENYWESIWQDDVQKWNKKYLLRLGVRLSHRFGQTFLKWMNVAHRAGMDKHQAADAFFLTKLLPVLSFRSNDVPDNDEEGTKKAVLKDWIAEIKKKQHPETKEQQYPETEKALDKMASKSSDFIRYLE